MLHRFDGEPVLLVPGAGTPMQLWHEPGLRLPQAAAQHIGKQVMVAIPVLFVIERDQKKIGTLQLFQMDVSMLRLVKSGFPLFPGQYSIA